MPTDPNAPIKYPCPHCQHRNIETVATAPYIRGMVLAYQYGTKPFFGCTRCVRLKVLGEAGLSALIGWFSITAVFVNPFLILYNLLQTPFIRVNYAKARDRLRAAGVPDDPGMDLTDVGYALAAWMITIDQTLAPAEVERARELGAKFLRAFDPQRLDEALGNVKTLPAATELAALLSELSPDGKKAMFDYLLAIAQADGAPNNAETQLLTDIAEQMKYTP